jgi:hypothetical protein
MAKINVEIFLKKIKKWLENPDENYMEIVSKFFIKTSYFMSISQNIKKECLIKGDINLITQFYIDADNNRQNEIKQTLFLNVHNNSIDKIYLFNEREYSNEELGISSNKIIQIIIENRLTFENIFNLVDIHNINGFIVIANSDIFFDKSINNIKQCDFKNKNVLSLCRYEYDGKTSLKNCKLFDNGRPDSQDTWIIHSDINIEKQYRNIFNFNMGKMGCDNKLIYLFNILGYQCYNEPQFIKTYHNHKSNIRNYKQNEKVPSPYCALYPVLKEYNQSIISKNNISFNILLDNERFCNYINEKIINNIPFIIPRIAGIENNIAYYSILLQNKNSIQSNILNNQLKTMKNNAGIKISNINSLNKYSEMYLKAFHQCDTYLTWEPYGNVAAGIFESLNFIHINFNKPKIWAFTLDIFNHINTKLWTRYLQGKKILIISPFVNSFKSKINIREKIYGIDLFPNCEFIFLKPPMTQGNCASQEFDIELNNFVNKIKNIKDTFDIALLSCGGYGNLLCSEIYNMNKSAIYIGGVLQMYFGVYGNRWERERPEIMTIYKNEYWSKPTEDERPDGFENVEKSCYW